MTVGDGDRDKDKSVPTFGDASVPALELTVGEAMTPLTLPEATGGDGALTYFLEIRSDDPYYWPPGWPLNESGLVFDPATRRLSGTPILPPGKWSFEYSVRDEYHNWSDGDGNYRPLPFLSFEVTVRDEAPTFGDASVAALALVQGAAMAAVVLPEATGGNGALTYTLTSEPAGLAGLSFDLSTRRLSGTPSGTGRYPFTYRADDADANRSKADAAILTFEVSVEEAHTARLKQTVRRTLVAVAHRALTGALDQLGARMAAEMPMNGLILAACGGGGSPVTGGPPVTKPPSVTKTPPVPSDPEAAPWARLRALRERADTLTMTGLHAHWALAAEGEEDLEDTFVERVTCAGARCVAADGPATAAGELLGPAIALGADAAQTGERGGFDTVRTVGGFAVTETLPDLAVTGSPQATTWGFWGAHGFAGLTLGAGPLSAEIDGTTRSGTFSLAQAWAAGTVSGGHPAGIGRATWEGLAEASPKGTFRRVAGTATVTIEDLSRPRVDVGIALDGVEAPLRWTDLPLAGGRFSAGTAGTDRLDGHFHGPAQEEAYGVFDTDRWLGAFGAKRRP